MNSYGQLRLILEPAAFIKDSKAVTLIGEKVVVQFAVDHSYNYNPRFHIFRWVII